MKDHISKIDQRILQLKKMKEKIQTQQSLIFFKESQRILGDKFSPELAAHILSHTWKSSSDHQKKEWEKTCAQGGEETNSSFRTSPQGSREKAPQNPTENIQS
ncbi:MAG: hypothetical protein K2W92_07475 [Alphaproteobacteria bacterium]|nr:hypothetical protein [Alphaproteobacteria bacterium]